MITRKLPDIEAKALLKTRLSHIIERYRSSTLSDEALALIITDTIPSELKEVQTTLTKVIDSQHQIISILNDNADKQRFYQYIQNCIDANYKPSSDIIDQWGEIRDDYFDIDGKPTTDQEV